MSNVRALVTAVLAAVGVLACANETAPPPGQRTFRDEVGRTCTVDVADALAVATCDVGPPDHLCLDTASCFAVRVMSGALVNCAGCGGVGSPGCYVTSAAPDCSRVVCVDDLDCPSPYAICREGACRAP